MPNVWPMATYVCLVEVALHLNDSVDLKAKRKHVHSLKAQLRKRFGASVAEVDHHDKWQRTELLCALVGGPELEARSAAIERFIVARFPDGSSCRRRLLSVGDLEE